MGLTLSKFSLLHTLLDKILQPAKHLSKISRYLILKGFQCLNILHGEKGTCLRVNLRLFFLLPKTDSPHIPAKHMKAAPGQIGISKESSCCIQHGEKIPGNKVQIPIV